MYIASYFFFFYQKQNIAHELFITCPIALFTAIYLGAYLLLVYRRCRSLFSFFAAKIDLELSPSQAQHAKSRVRGYAAKLLKPSNQPQMRDTRSMQNYFIEPLITHDFHL